MSNIVGDPENEAGTVGETPGGADPWVLLRRFTAARVGLGRAGDSVPTGRLLEFEIAHAQARDAVHTAVDFTAIRTGLTGWDTLEVRSAAPDRATYLRHPDLGRRLDPHCDSLPPTPDNPGGPDRLAGGRFDVVFVIADGLSARAVHDHAAPMLLAVLPRLPDWRIAPVVLATQARVALGDEIGQRLRADLVVMLIGERPGLSAADSLGIYLTAHPKTGRRDHERNCISNIHPPGGLDYHRAADTLTHLMTQARHLGITGTTLKDDLPTLPQTSLPQTSLPQTSLPRT
jgi:ethanolamine ammonia-lyase small subunit